MKKIGILSDTHGYLDERMLYYLKESDEIWHAGDWGSVEISDRLAELAPVKGVFGNIDGEKIRQLYPETLRFTIEQVKVFIIHIGGYPGHYAAGVKERLKEAGPDLFICGHSHIAKVVSDKALNLLHINPGAAGKSGFHHIRTLVLLEIDGNKIQNLRMVELGKRAVI